MLFCFLFKQKTAYEMRISDWSSDVCSSDLAGRLHGRPGSRPGFLAFLGALRIFLALRGHRLPLRHHGVLAGIAALLRGRLLGRGRLGALLVVLIRRSEERPVGKTGVSTCRSCWSPYT